MTLAGHVLIGEHGAILEMDHGFTELLHSRPERLRGVPILDITAPADREECARAIARLRRTGRPFNIIKRFQREDASLLWVQNAVSIMSGTASNRLVVATCTAVAPDVERRHPAALLANAHALMALGRERVRVTNLPFLTETGWNVIVTVYIAEAEGRTVDVGQLAAAVGESQSVVARWVALLVRDGVLELETRDPQPDAPKSYRLTGQAVARLEDYLRRFLVTASDARPVGVRLS